jgi:hypothetical protein
VADETKERPAGSFWWINGGIGWRPAEWYDGLWWTTGSEVPVTAEDIEVGEEIKHER